MSFGFVWVWQLSKFGLLALFELFANLCVSFLFVWLVGDWLHLFLVFFVFLVVFRNGLNFVLFVRVFLLFVVHIVEVILFLHFENLRFLLLRGHTLGSLN